MSNWITIAVTDLNDYLVAAQVNALRTAALASGQADPFTNVMRDVIAEVRFKIQSCPANKLSATAYTIPPELKKTACYLILESMQNRIPALKLTEDQKGQVDRAVAQLNRIADCRDKITQPTDPIGTDATASSTPSIIAKPLSFTRINQDGI